MGETTSGESVAIQLFVRCQTCDKPWVGADKDYESVRQQVIDDSWSDEGGEWQCPEHKSNPETHRRY